MHPKQMKKLAQNLADGIAGRMRGPKPVRWVEGRIIRFFLEQMVERIGRLERVQPTEPLSPRAGAGLNLYLGGPLRNQLLGENERAFPDRVTFIFGHTHKPFETVLTPKGFGGRSVEVYNTGGWVVDTLEPRPLQGGAAILLDEELNAVSLRLYNQTADGTATPVKLSVANPSAAGENPFYRRLSSLVDAEKPPWTNLSTAASQLVKERHQEMETIIGSVTQTMG
jgi:hypothetical protein